MSDIPTIEAIASYSNACLTDISGSSVKSSPRSSITEENIINNGISIAEDKLAKLKKLQLELFSDSRDSSFNGFSNTSSNDSSILSENKFVEKDVDICIDSSLILILDKLAKLEILLNTEKEHNIILKNKLNNLENKYNNEFSYLNNDITELFEGLNNVDLKVLQLDQYTRRESLVISGIDDNVSQDHLEFTVLNILRSIGLFNVSSYEITACHRLFNKNKKFPARTIIRFTNRKIVEFCLRNRDKLYESRHELQMNLRFYEHLTECNESVYKECVQLAKYEIIDSYYIRNGFVKVVVNVGDRPIKIYHTASLDDRFKNFYDHHYLDYMP